MKRSTKKQAKSKKGSAKQEKGELHMTPQDLVDEVAKQTTTVASLKAYTSGLRQKLADAIAAGGGVMDQATLDKVFADISANDAALADAMVENVPPASIP